MNGGAAFTLTGMIRRVVAGASLIFLGLSFSFAAAVSKPNLVLITLDSTRADRVGFLGAKGAHTPSLDRLAGESLVFERAYAQAPGSVVSHATILSGAYPQSTGMTEIGGTLSSSLPYLPELLKMHGYRTAALVGSIDLDPRNGLAQGFDRGFETYDAGFRPAMPGDARPPLTERRGDEVAARAIAWLDHNARQQFFLWVHITDTHINDARAGRASYNSAITAADAAIGKLLSALQQRKIYGNTAVIVVADHGESLGAHGEDTHGVFLYDETIHVPLLVKLPASQVAKPATGRVSAKVRLVDIAPTVLEIAGFPVPSQMQGQSLLRVAKSSAGSDQPVYSRADLPQRGFGWSPLESWRAGKYLYIRAPRPELYDLTADPGATHNLAQSSKATLDTMAAQLETFDRHFSGEAGKSSAELSSSEMQKLASLGYVGLQKSSGTAAAVAGTDPKDKIATANKVMEAASTGNESKPDRAIAALTPVVSADPNLYLAQYALGAALARKGQYAEAAKHLHKAIELQPDSAWAHYEIGASLLKTSGFKTAVVHLEIATGRQPAFAPAHLSLAEAYEHVGRTEDAKRERSKGK
ncbi:MAG: sulfatase-like hydrolase/transferase [Acidobacteriia bacterium]|nr:sulfatase-like hydrolase/transferase [Terriglobia bacterium]